MNIRLSKKIVAAMMVTTLGAATCATAADAVVPVDLAKAEATKAAKTETAHVGGFEAIRAVDISQELREELADKIVNDMGKLAAKHAKKNEADPVIVVGQVKPGTVVDLNLPKTVRMALDNNRDIKQAKYDLRGTDYDIDLARAGKMPQVTYGWSGGRGRNHTSGSPYGAVTANSYGNTLGLNIPLYTGGKVEGQIAQAKIGKTNAQEELLRTQQVTKYNAIQGYYALLAYQEYRDVYHESVDNLQGHLNNVTAQYNAGTVAKLDVLSSDVSLADAKTQAVTADNSVDLAEASLNNIIGLPIQTKLELADHQLPFDAYDISLQDALDYAMRYRPEVLQAALGVQKAEEDVNIAKAGNRPTIGIGASNGWSDSGYIFGSEDKNWKVAGTVSYSLWDGGATNAKIKRAKEDLLAAREKEQQVRETVQLDVKQSYLNIQSAAQRVESTATAVDQAEESFKIASVRYQAGVGINLDVLDAQLRLNTAKTNHIQALYDYNVGIAKLEQAMGVDVRTGVIRPAAAAAPVARV